jgi:hypothetical protein
MAFFVLLAALSVALTTHLEGRAAVIGKRLMKAYLARTRDGALIACEDGI